QILSGKRILRFEVDLRMDIIAIQEKIDGTQYWDERILAVNFSYFGDEVEIWWTIVKE
ncbi:hypothetical protein SAMN05216390_11857, partial [Lachnospiraceae bacterium KH1T2]